jgi:four helix bundle protein
MRRALERRMVARSLDELLVYQKAVTASRAVSAILKTRGSRMDRDLRGQLGSASASVGANIAEGFGQQSDRQFARYLFIARGSTQEMRALLAVAHERGYVTEAEMMDLSEKYEELARMLTGLIKHLRAADRKQRG